MKKMKKIKFFIKNQNNISHKRNSQKQNVQRKTLETTRKERRDFRGERNAECSESRKKLQS